MRRLVVPTLVWCLVASSVMAQEPTTRAGEIARKQEEKAAATAPRKPNRIEQRLLDMERAGGFGVTRGWFVAFGGIKSGSGFALGPAYTKVLDNGALLQAKAAYSFRNFKLLQLSAQSAPVADRRVTFFTRARWHDAPVLAFFPLGPDSPDTRADFAERATEVSGRTLWQPVRLLKLGGGVSFETYDIRNAGTNRPTVAQVTAANPVPGIVADPHYVHSHVSAALDSRDGPGYSRQGTLLQATLHDYRDVGRPAPVSHGVRGFTFQRVDGVAEQYIPILHGNWVIYLGLRASTTTTDTGDAVPFFLLPKLGGSDLRGYRSWRFRDRHAILVSAEYRWYVQEFVDFAIFYDAGKVVAERSRLNLKGLTDSIGAGIRFHGPQTTALRLEVARGREGLRLIFAFSPVGG